jgi:competence CoiA-like predicted nuclease
VLWGERYSENFQTRYPAHARSRECITAPETAEHLLAKDIIAKAVLAAGWEAKTECAGQSFGNEDWIADVMAIKDRKRIAIEVQWSRQDREVTKLRQERYMRSGVTGLWLVRHTQNLVMENDTPVFRLRFQEEARTFLVMLPSPSFDTFLVNSHNKHDRRFW